MSAGLREAVLVNFLFWTGIAVGAVVFSALLELTDAAWARPLRPLADRCRWFLPPSLAIFVVAFASARALHWRDAVALAATYASAFWFCRAPRVRAAVIFVVVYAAAFSAIAIDVIMPLEPGWVSTLFPAYSFTANVYGGIAAVAAMAAVALPRDEFNRSLARDLAAVVVGFALIWIYFTWTQFLVIWYGNLSSETAFVIRRMAGRRQALAWTVFALRCALPIAVLLTRSGRTRTPLAVVAAAGVAGFWIECWLIVAPALPGSATPLTMAVVTAGFAVLFAASLWWAAASPSPARPPGAARRGPWPARSVRGN